MPLSAVINRLFAKGSGPAASVATEITANSVGAISTAPGFLTGKATLPVGTPIGYTVMLYAGDPTFQQLLLTVNTNAAAVGANFVLEAASNPAGGINAQGWNSLQYIFSQTNTSTGTGVSGYFNSVATQIPSPSGRTSTFAAGIAGMSYVRLRLTVAVNTNPLELAWNVITTASVPPVWNPSIGSGGGVVDGSGLSESILTGGSQANPVLAVTPMLSQGATNTLVYQRIPTKFNTAIATNAGNTAAWTPAAGKKFRLMRYQLELTENATLAVAALITVKFQDNVTDFGFQHDQLIPAAAGAVAGEAWRSGWIDLGNGYLSLVANNVLNFNISGAANLTAGQFRVNTCGTEE